MRMWMVHPRLLCRKHLLGEHGEIHKHRHNFVKHHSIAGRYGQIEPRSMQRRHDELAQEMVARGFNHKSPYTQPNIDYLPIRDLEGTVDTEASYKDLLERCPGCRERKDNAGSQANGLTKKLP